MNLSGVELIWFLPAVLLLHWLLPRRAWLQNLALVLAGQVFYASWNVRLLPVLWLAVAVDYAVGRFLGAHPLEGRELAPDQLAREKRLRRVALGASLVFDLGLLGFFKYAGFFAESLNDLLGVLGLPPALPVLRLALPLGISYWTLQKLAYVLDLYYERVPACRDPLGFAAYTMFFPQLIAGPITRARSVLPQFLAPRRLDPGMIASGAAWFLFGLTLKSWAADFLALHLVNPVWADPDAFDRASHWGGLVGYALQLFCDFGGYSFLAVGAGKLLGIDLPHNFDRPFLARSMMEMWRRWHITLNTWLFDYLFAPLTTGRSWFRGRMVAGFLLVFLASGLWHGALWTFVLWGLAQGLALSVAYRWDLFYKGLCRQDRAWVARRASTAYATAAWLVTQSFFLVTLIPFRAPSLERSFGYLRGLFVTTGDAHANLAALNLLLASAVVVGYHLTGRGRGAQWLGRFQASPAWVRGLVYGLLLAFLLIYAPVGAGTFIYADF
jgi:D-alanyl-lipoteichoic acid acyltransferase DltB (MBOAT superfamily)